MKYMIIVLAFCFVGCNYKWAPWNRGPRWGSNEIRHTRAVRPVPPDSSDAPTRRYTGENFCIEMKETVDLWRTYLEPNYVWTGISSASKQTRIRYIKSFIGEYDLHCDVQ